MTQVLAINAVAPLPPAEAERLLLEEAQVVTRQYLEGKVERFWSRRDGRGGVMVLNTAILEEAEAWVKALPLTREGYLTYELIPIGPLATLGALLESAGVKPAATSAA
jgi:hypothetical protein